ncbi:MAG: hypothetical protein U0836_09535 [Pirellulales bacterium]
MSRRRARDNQGTAVTLFQFLDVLLCTMGALILLLVVIAHRASKQAAEEVADQKGAVQSVVDELEWRASVLEGSREPTRAAFERARNEVAYLEARIRELEAQLAQRQQAAEELMNSVGRTQQDRSQVEAELARMQQELLLARQRLDEERKAVAARPKSFAIVPYQGKHGTRRRPVYFECDGESVVLQPEGVRFEAEDFQALGPGNPLSAAMRATRQYIVTQQGTADDPSFDPYPLLLVRPSGIPAYYVARAALESYGGDFGYELIDEDWKLALPPPDPQLADAQRSAANEARQRFRVLALAAPKLYGRNSGGYGGGGFEDAAGFDEARRRVGAGLGGNSAYPGGGYGESETGEEGYGGAGTSPSGRPANWAMRGRGQGSGRGPGASRGQGRWSSHDEADLLAEGAGSGGDMPGSEASGALPHGFGNTAGQGFGTEEGKDGAYSGTDNQGGGRGTPGSFDPQATPGPGGATGQAGEGPESGGAYAGGNGPAGSEAGAPTGGTEAGQGMSAAAGGSASDASGAAQSSGAGSAASAGSGQPPAAGGSPSSMFSFGNAPPGAAGGKPAQGVQGPRGDRARRSGGGGDSLEKTRGENWAMRQQPAVNVPVGRPVRIECRSDRLTIRPEKRGVEPIVVPLEGGTAGSVDQLVAAVWEEVDSWGFAGNGFSWRPELRLEVFPGGEGRYEDLKALMVGSGLEVRSVRAPTQANGRPSRKR